jgi:hypothetical protein
MKPIIILALLALAACSGETSGEATSGTDVMHMDPAVSPPMQNEGVAGGAPIGRQESGGNKVGQPAALGISPPRPSALADSASTASVAPSMLIRTGNASVEVDSVELAVARVQELAQRLGGYVGNTSVSGGEQATRSATLELKIPAARFDQAIGGCADRQGGERAGAGGGRGRGVRGPLRPHGQRAAAGGAALGLLATRTGKLEDVLAVERELARVRQEIDTQEGRLRYLRSRAAVSTLTVTVHEPRPLIGDYPRARPIARRSATRGATSSASRRADRVAGLPDPAGAHPRGIVWLVRRYRRRRAAPPPK